MEDKLAALPFMLLIISNFILFFILDFQIDRIKRKLEKGEAMERMTNDTPSTQNERVNSNNQLDCISRQAAIDALADYIHNMDKVLGTGRLTPYDCKDAAASVFEELPSVQRWIPCSEGLPYADYGKSDTVLTTCGYRDVEDTRVRWIRLLYFNGGNWCYPTGETYDAKVLAWMPLPKPWKGKQNG